jgi:hypothetical protein
MASGLTTSSIGPGGWVGLLEGPGGGDAFSVSGATLWTWRRDFAVHILNPVPIRLIHDRWIDKYSERQVSAFVDLKTELDKN